jgi:hypothetical protein
MKEYRMMTMKATREHQAMQMKANQPGGAKGEGIRSGNAFAAILQCTLDYTSSTTSSNTGIS